MKFHYDFLRLISRLAFRSHVPAIKLRRPIITSQVEERANVLSSLDQCLKMNLSSGITTLILLALLRDCDAKVRENVEIKGSTQPPCWSRRSGECESIIILNWGKYYKAEKKSSYVVW